MFKSTQHTFRQIAICIVFITLLSCKNHHTLHSSKTVAQSENNNPATPTEIKYGNLFIDACGERMKGNFKESKKLFEECLLLNPKNPAPYYELSVIYKMTGDRNAALQNAKRCAAANEQNEWYQLLLAECFVANNQIQNAIKVRESLIKQFPKKNDLKEELAYEYSLVGQYDKAFKLYDELEKTFGPNEQTTYNKLKILKSIKDYKRAEEELLKLSAGDNNQARYYNDLADLYVETGQLEKAKNMYDKILAVDPNNPTVYLALHDYHVNTGNLPAAKKDLEKAIENPFLDIALKAQIIEDYYKRAERGNREAFEEGMALSLAASKVHPLAMPINALCGDFNRLDKNNKSAMLYYFKAVNADKNNYRLWQNLLIVENDLYLNDSVARHAGQALEIFPNQPVFYLYAGIANGALKKHEIAEQQLNDGLALSFGNKRLTLDFLSASGDNYFQLKQHAKSDNSFEEALKIDADNTYVLNNYAYYLSLRNDKTELAEKLARRANELKPNNANYLDTYAWVLFKEKKYLSALEMISQAAKLNPSPTILEHYGDILFFSDKPNEAVQQWQQAKAAGNKSEILIKKISEKKWYE